MRMLVFTMVALLALVTCYSVFAFGGPTCAVVFLSILFFGVLDRVAEPFLKRLRA